MLVKGVPDEETWLLFVSVCVNENFQLKIKKIIHTIMFGQLQYTMSCIVQDKRLLPN